MNSAPEGSRAIEWRSAEEDAEMKRLAREADAAASAMALACGQGKHAALLHYKKAMCQLLRYLVS